MDLFFFFLFTSAAAFTLSELTEVAEWIGDEWFNNDWKDSSSFFIKDSPIRISSAMNLTSSDASSDDDELENATVEITDWSTDNVFFFSEESDGVKDDDDDDDDDEEDDDDSFSLTLRLDFEEGIVTWLFEELRAVADDERIDLNNE